MPDQTSRPSERQVRYVRWRRSRFRNAPDSDQIHSDQLDSDYSAIYRTAEEYVKLYSIFTKQGFHFAEQAYFPPEINGTRYNDSDRWYAILKR